MGAGSRVAFLRATGSTPASWGYVDIALGDLFAKAQGLPLFRAIGGFRDRLPVYLSPRFGDD